MASSWQPWPPEQKLNSEEKRFLDGGDLKERLVHHGDGDQEDGGSDDDNVDRDVEDDRPLQTGQQLPSSVICSARGQSSLGQSRPGTIVLQSTEPSLKENSL